MVEDIWQQALARERHARMQAEQLLESSSRELLDANVRLRALVEEMEQRVMQRTRDLSTARDQALAAEQQAAAASAAKSSFLTNISHEIRTPMTAILGYAQLLRADGPRTPEQAGWCEELLRHARYLTSLLDDVLDLSRIEAGQVELHLEPTPVVLLLEEVEALHAPAAARQGLRLYREQQGEIPDHLRTDRARLRQILVNLTDNAIQFTEEVAVTLRAIGTLSQLRLEVEDTGPGLPDSVLAQLEAPPSAIPGPPAATAVGRARLGLGLDITRRLVVLLGGTLQVRSTPGRGTVFTVTLPLDALPAQPSEPETSAGRLPRLDGVSILLVDDSDDTRRLVRLLLERAGARVRTCADGQQALVQLRAAPRSADVVLMDIQMPVLDGLETTRRLRAHGLTIPIVAVTADATTETCARIAAVGFSAQLTKPLLLEGLLRCIHAVLPAHLRPPPTEGPPRLHRVSRMDLPEWLMVAFKQDLATKLAQLSSIQSSAEIRSLAHKIAGSGGSYGYNELTVAARALMAACEGGGDITGALETLMEESRAILEP